MSDEETYEIPLQDQRIFGAGIKRKRVKFVPSTDSSNTLPTSSNTPSRSIGDLYLSLVLPGDSKEGTPKPSSTRFMPAPESAQASDEHQICEVCNLPVLPTSTEESPEAAEGDKSTRSRPHEASLAHQVCLTHSHLPSHLDRGRKGLTYLSAYGWNPDARMGLGVSGQGIQFPIKTKPKDDKLGLGVVFPPEAERRKKEKVKQLDAGKVRKLHEKDRRKAEKLREILYRNDDVERYLGGG